MKGQNEATLKQFRTSSGIRASAAMGLDVITKSLTLMARYATERMRDKPRDRVNFSDADERLLKALAECYAADNAFAARLYHASMQGGYRPAGEEECNRLAPDEVAQIKQLIQDGFNNGEIARRFGVSPTPIRRIRCDMGFGGKTVGRPAAHSPEKRKQALMMLNAGDKHGDIADVLDVPAGTISRWWSEEKRKRLREQKGGKVA